MLRINILKVFSPTNYTNCTNFYPRICEILVIRGFFISFCLLFGFELFSQTPELNRQKYWHYRDRLRNEFMVVSSGNEQGTNIPAVKRVPETLTLDWNDGNVNMSHYLSILATEYRLLKNRKQDYSQTIHELFYALRAVERLDYYAETKFFNTSKQTAVQGTPNLNGFFIRDDIPEGFCIKNPSHFTDRNNGTIYKTVNSVYTDKGSTDEMSQDNVWHLLEGLGLIKSLVDNEIVDGDEVNFKQWTQTITNRIIKRLQHYDKILRFDDKFGEFIYWYVWNPVTDRFVAEGSGKDCGTQNVFSYGLAEAGNFIMDYSHGSSRMHYKGSQKACNAFVLVLRNKYWILFGLKRIYTDNYNVKSLVSTSGHIEGWSGSQVYESLLDCIQINNLNFNNYEHFPLIFLVNHAKEYPEIDLYGNLTATYPITYHEYLLNLAPPEGPHSFTDRATYSEYWRTTSRLVFPDVSKVWNEEYAGLDYMLLYNLYTLIYKEPIFILQHSKTNDFPITEISHVSHSIIKSYVLNYNLVPEATVQWSVSPANSVTLSRGTGNIAYIQPLANKQHNKLTLTFTISYGGVNKKVVKKI